jgi:multiple sugar transport system ATP-binding protein
MAFPLRLAKVDNATVKDKVTEAAKILDLSNHLDRRPANLSGGQRQRVAMGRAIVRSPKAFLMDEPLSNLDAKLRVQMRTSVSKLQKQLGTTTVYVTHDQTEAMTLGDRVVVLRGGVVQQVGPPQHLYENPANLFVAGFIGSPAMNFVPVELAEGELRSALGDVPLPERLRKAAEAADAPRDLVLGIRPEHFEDAALVDDAVKTRGATFTGEVDVVEEMGSDKYVYFTLQGAKASSAELDELAADSGSSEVPTDDGQVVTRLSVESRARENEQLSVWFDTDKIHLFNPKTGETIR